MGDEEAELAIIESGADDYHSEDGEYIIYCKSDSLSGVKDYLVAQSFEILSSELVFLPKEEINLDEERSAKIIKLLESLDNLDDVTSVSSNLA
ncbi:MAG: putative transcriptional regulatory protein [candidate division WS2 bacterium ADurb.Bin280]|uniref:Putative transcriptional regulatory protein n=1 Tax=candidate division WS2 bacterium ADurb.Bin280 TaxID=1852829 RepID=A0A1V5SFR4_9BACT|nr:MAG: putative transcriptional regulatory protein [candidate division WS2 bacterium ADurb.Bin280]